MDIAIIDILLIFIFNYQKTISWKDGIKIFRKHSVQQYYIFA